VCNDEHDSTDQDNYNWSSFNNQHTTKIGEQGFTITMTKINNQKTKTKALKNESRDVSRTTTTVDLMTISINVLMLS